MDFDQTAQQTHVTGVAAPTAERARLIPHQAKLYGYELSRRFAGDDPERIAASLADAQVDLNPHQIEAALFAFRSPFAKGALLADEVGLGKTIEASLVLAQRWAEQKRNLIIICPASLRKQWAQELHDKFNLPTKIVETQSFNAAIKNGDSNPFQPSTTEPAIFVCSYEFASKKTDYLVAISWHLVVIDEAHRLRNVYKSGNKIAKAICTAFLGSPKLLLTATPLQNSIMELYGLISVIDEHIFGDEKVFRSQFGRIDNDEAYSALRSRLEPVCTRTLRRQVREYVPYTSRIPLTQEFVPSKDEQALYDLVSDYLQRDRLNALPNAQRQLMILVMRKLLASSTFAIAGALDSLVRRLETSLKENAKLQAHLDAELEEDYEDLPAVREEWDEDEQEQDPVPLSPVEIASIETEVAELKSFRELAISITENAKGEALLAALQAAFTKAGELGASEKAIIFTESRRTQDYLVRLLTQNGYENQIVLFNGTNADTKSRGIYAAWIERHRGSDRVSGSKSADMRAALVDFFREEARVMIATEAAAEGINLQFCSLVVNYDLPWNPQRVEQRIGRCHRYGQKHDVVVVNFLNKNNAADQRVYELLDEKFCLFSGVFGASDEILGVIESGVDFERRVVEIYQRSRTRAEIESEFARLRTELEEQIQATMLETRQKLLENFDADVTDRLKLSLAKSRDHLTKIESLLWSVTRYVLGECAEFSREAPKFELRTIPSSCPSVPLGSYELSQKPHKLSIRYRPGHALASFVVESACHLPSPDGNAKFDYTGWGQKSEALRPLVGSSGILLARRLQIRTIEIEDHILLAGITDSGVELSQDQLRRMIELPVLKFEANESNVPSALDVVAEKMCLEAQERLRVRQSHWFDEEMSKLDRWADDKRSSLKAKLHDLDDEIKFERKCAREAGNLPEKLSFQRRVKELEKRRDSAWHEYDHAAADVQIAKERLIDDIESRLEQKIEVERLFALRWEVA